MKKLSQSTKQDLKNIEQTLIQDLSEQQANTLTGGQRLQEEFQAELSTLRGSNSVQGKIKGVLLLVFG